MHNNMSHWSHPWPHGEEGSNLSHWSHPWPHEWISPHVEQSAAVKFTERPVHADRGTAAATTAASVAIVDIAFRIVVDDEERALRSPVCDRLVPVVHGV